MALANTGVSCSLRRTYRPTITSAALSRNGIRQPHERNCSSSSTTARVRNRPLAARKPMDGPSCGNMPNQARLPFGAFSVASNAAPPHSPPNPRPWPKRRTQSRIGAQAPMLSYPGSTPISVVHTPISSSEATRVDLRPIRSPK
ncbi:hypothetical protein D3C81_1433860 [compost metagenome]